MIWAHYILQVNIYLILFYCFYKFLLSKETYFAFNRVYLVGSGILSLAIPFLRFEWFTKQEAAQTIYQGVDRLTTMVGTVTFLPEEEASINWGKIIVLVYLCGVVFLVARLLFKLSVVKRLTAEASSGIAFSFFNKKMIDPQLPQTAVINHHEDIHIKQYHSVDILLFEILSIFLWFNPVIYLYKHTIKSIHEFLADENAAKFQGSKEEYAMLLLSKAFNVDPQMLTSNFYSKSLIKRRIFMLHKQRSKKIAVLKYGLSVPLFGLTLVLSSATIRKNEKILEVAAQLPIVQTISETAGEVPEMFGAAGNDGAELTALIAADSKPFKGNTSDKKTPLIITRHDLRGTSSPTEALKLHIQAIPFKTGETRISFNEKSIKSPLILVDGVKKESKILNEINPADIENISVLRADAATSLYGSEAANGAFLVTTKNLTDIKITGATTKPPKDEEEVERTVEPLYDYASLEAQPRFPGGLENFRNFLARNMNYPKAALKSKKQGVVYVNFTIEKDGSLTDIGVDKKIGFGLDEEAIRVVKSSKRWIPGIQNGRLVRVKYNIPIKFVI